MTDSPKHVQIFAAASNAAFADRIGQALHGAGFDIVNGAFDAEKTDVVIVVWSGSSISASKLIEAARAPLAAGAVVPVSIGRIEPPEEFRRLPPIDLGGWTGAVDDLRWRAVVGEIERVAAARSAAPEEDEPAAMVRDEPETAAVIADWPKAERAGAGFTPSLAAAPQGIRLQPSLVFGLTLIGAVILGGFVSLVSRLSHEDAAPQETAAPVPAPEPEVGAAPVLAVIEPAPASEQGIDAAPPPEDEAAPAAEAPHTDQIAELIADNDEGEGRPAAQEATLSEARLIKDCGMCPELAVIPVGRFTMGAPEGERQRRDAETPLIEINIARPFALSTHEITFAEWDACVAAEGCPALPDYGWGRGAQPAINVSWEDAQSYVAWLSKTAGVNYRLPTEAEWEYAARAGDDKPFSFGDGVSSAQANFDGSIPYMAKPGPARGRPLPVGKFAPNAFGLYDMHGNVWEWAADCWTATHQGQPADGSARAGACSRHVLKGGAWNTGGWRLRAAHRIGKNAKAREYDNGFRVARDL